MKELLLDDGLPAGLAAELLRRGRATTTVRELGLEAASDAELVAAAAARGAVLVTVEPSLPDGAARAVVAGRDHAALREAVHRHAHEMAAQRPGSARRYRP